MTTVRGVMLHCDKLADDGELCDEVYAASVEWPDYPRARAEAAEYGWTYAHGTDQCGRCTEAGW